MSILLGVGLLQLLLAISEQLMHASVAGILQLDSLGVGDKGALSQIATDRIRDGSYRSQALFSHPIILGHFAAALSVLAASKVSVSRTVFGKSFAVFIFTLALLASVFSGTRSSLGLTIFGLALFFIFLKRNQARDNGIFALKFAVIASIAIVALFVGGSMIGEFISGRTAAEAGSTETRSVQLYNGLDALSENPLFGFGLGLGDEYGGVINQFGQATIDNFYLSVALNSGYVGLFFWVIFVISAIRCSIKSFTRSSWENYILGIALSVFNAVLFVGLFVQSIIDLLSIQMIVLAWFVSTASSQFRDRQRERGLYGPMPFSLTPQRHRDGDSLLKNTSTDLVSG